MSRIVLFERFLIPSKRRSDMAMTATKRRPSDVVGTTASAESDCHHSKRTESTGNRHTATCLPRTQGAENP